MNCFMFWLLQRNEYDLRFFVSCSCRKWWNKSFGKAFKRPPKRSKKCTNFPHYFRNFESRNFFRKLQVLIKYCHILWHRSRQWNLANLICKSLTFQSVLINWMKLNNWFYFEFCFLKDEFCETAATARSRSRFVLAVFARHFTRWMGKGKK